LATLEAKFSASQSWWAYVGGDVAREAEDALVQASSKSEFGRLAVRKTLQRTRDELAGPCPSPLVGLAARRVAMCKLEADLAYESSAMSLERNVVPAEAIQRWLDRADARCRKAVRTLADLQRLQLPVVIGHVAPGHSPGLGASGSAGDASSRRSNVAPPRSRSSASSCAPRASQSFRGMGRSRRSEQYTRL
jgi:hypothetical protein